jgi:SAM-dependent methyltransferase
LKQGRMNLKTERGFRRVVKSWDDYWAEFWHVRLMENDAARLMKNQQVATFCREILQLKKGESLLDLGCGAGFQSLLFAEFGLEVLGIDISPPLIAHAKKLAARRQARAHFQVGDMRTISFKSEFDAVVILGCSFGFGDDNENRRTLKNIDRALRPNGRVLLTGQHSYNVSNQIGPEWLETRDGILLHRGEFDARTSRVNGIWELIQPDGTIVTEGDNPEEHGIRCYTVPELEQMFREAGLEATGFYGTWLLPPTPLQWFSDELIAVGYKRA